SIDSLKPLLSDASEFGHIPEFHAKLHHLNPSGALPRIIAFGHLIAQRLYGGV
ncbi:MAG: hypothetical protein ACI8S3_002017, partial [Alphaproteobacteria bacterium]